MVTMQVVMTVSTPDGDEERTVMLPARWCICGQCSGTGKSSAYLGAFTRDEMDQQGVEFMEDYMSGAYDRPCDNCEGGKYLEADRERIQARDVDEEMAALRWLDDQAAQAAEERAIVRMETMGGA